MEILFFILIISIYFLPSIISNRKENGNSIFVINLFLGWTLIGWVVALSWALKEDNSPVSQPFENSRINENKPKTANQNSLLSKEKFFLRVYKENELVASNYPAYKELYERILNYGIASISELEHATNDILSTKENVKDKSSVNSSAVDRIQQLDELLQKGLIADADYQLKKKEIIDSI